MRSFASLLTLLVLVTGATLGAQSATPRRLYNDALARERVVRHEMDTARTPAARAAARERVRSLVASYERMAGRYPASGYMDNALWQGALLSADAFWAWGETADKTAALRLFSALRTRFPTSSLVKQTPSHVRRLENAKATPARANARTPTPAPANARAAAPAPAPSGGTAAPSRATAAPAAPAVASTAAPASGPAELTAVRRDVLDDTVRVTLEIGREVPFKTDRLGGPDRVFVDLDDTRAVAAIQDAALPFTDDVVTQVRIGRQSPTRTRVVMDLAAGAAHPSVFTLYNPYRIVVDFPRPAGARAVAERAAVPAAPTAPPVAPAANAAARPAAPEPPALLPETGVAVLPAIDLSERDVDAPGAPDDLVEPSASPAVPATPPPGATAPAAPRTNTSGQYSLSRQLGLGVSRIVIDPGHGGHDPGAKVKGLTEAGLVLDIALRLEKLLRKQPGVEVVMTRRTDVFIPLEERTEIANREGADLFLSIHANASRNTAARGVETYFLNLTANPEAEAVAARENAASGRSMRQLPDIVRAIALNNKIQESRDFASMIQSSLATDLQKTDHAVRNLGVKQAPFLVLLGATMPSVLAEVSFITNRKDAALLATDKYRQRIAEALYAGIVRYQQSLERAPAIAAR